MEPPRETPPPSASAPYAVGSMEKTVSLQNLKSVSEALAYSPSAETYLDQIEHLPADELPKKYVRTTRDRIFVNRDLRLEKIKYVGFDMDYTLADYLSPHYEELQYNLAIADLVKTFGYPEALLQTFSYDPSFPIRGLLIDRARGNFLKIDSFGAILKTCHGKSPPHKTEESAEIYSSMVVRSSEIGGKYIPCNTLFDLPQACLYADLINYFESISQKNGSDGPESNGMGGENRTNSGQLQRHVSQSADENAAIMMERITIDKSGSLRKLSRQSSRSSDVEDAGDNFGPEKQDVFAISYASLYEDMKLAFDRIHLEGTLKTETMRDLDKYVSKTGEKLKFMLHRLRQQGRFIFLLTNSEWNYTDAVMSYLLDRDSAGAGEPVESASNQVRDYACWRDYFDIMFVNARKPKWFGAGSNLREVDVLNGQLKLSMIDTKTDQKDWFRGKVFSGGNIDNFHGITGAKGQDVLFIGDHIFADVMVAKKTQHWRSLLVIRELLFEIDAFEESKELRDRLRNLEWVRAEMYRGMALDSEAQKNFNMTALRNHIHNAREEVDSVYNESFGSLFRSGSQSSYFAWQMQRYADIYTSQVDNLSNYPGNYMFTPIMSVLPHES